MQAVFNFLFRLILVAAGLVFAASLALIAVVLMVLWGVRAVWCKLTGQPVNPFVVRMSPRTGFGNVFRSRPSGQQEQDGPAKSKRVSTDDVTDVEAKDLGHPPR
jgi:hypothetical protein